MNTFYCENCLEEKDTHSQIGVRLTASDPASTVLADVTYCRDCREEIRKALDAIGCAIGATLFAA